MRRMPSKLKRSLLWAGLAVALLADTTGDGTFALSFCEDFERSFVSRLPRNSWTFTEKDIENAIQQELMDQMFLEFPWIFTEYGSRSFARVLGSQEACVRFLNVKRTITGNWELPILDNTISED